MNFLKGKNYVLLLSILILSIVTFGCSSNNETQISNENEDNQTVTIGLMPDEASVPFVIAEELGYFEEAGIDVKTQIFFSAVQRDSAVQADELQGISTDIISAGFYKSQSDDYTITSDTQGTFALVGKDFTDFDAIKDFTNSNDTKIKIGLSTNTLMEFILDYMLTSEEIDLEHVEKINISAIPSRLEMLNQGQIQLATLPQPFYEAALNSGSHSIAQISDYQVNPGVFIMHKDIASNSEWMTQYNTAYNRAVEYINNTPSEEYYPILVEKLSFPENQIPLPVYHEISLPNEKDIELGLQWLNDKSFINETWSFEEMTTNTIN